MKLKHLIPHRVRQAVKPTVRAADGAARRLLFGPAVRVPEPVRREWAGRLGDGFVTRIDRRDEMYQYLHRNVPAGRAAAEYFSSGASAVGSLADRLAESGRPLGGVGRMLEFACGYGRNTRHLVVRLDAGRVVVSDIDPHAVDANAAAFGTTGAYSAESAADLSIGGRFDVIFVASLFSHLSVGHFGPWIEKLLTLLAPGGVLAFTTHGPGLLGRSVDPARVRVEEGFFFMPESETERLDKSVYGSTYVAEDWVRRLIEAGGPGRSVTFHPRAVWQQDLFLVTAGDGSAGSNGSTNGSVA